MLVKGTRAKPLAASPVPKPQRTSIGWETLRFTDWWFVHKARLGLVKLNGYFESDSDKMKCRCCGYESETLSHVLNCRKKMLSGKVTQHHNRIVARIKKAALGHWSIYKENQPLRSENLRPDLVLCDGENNALLIDVTMPFESGIDSFHRARAEKDKKYEKLFTELKSRFQKVNFEAIVVGPLGSWDARNDCIISRLCSRKYASLMKKLIRASRDIFFEYLTGIPQVDNHSRFCEIQHTNNNLPTSLYGKKNRNLFNTLPRSSRNATSPENMTDANEPVTNTSPDCDILSPGYDSSNVFKNACITHVYTQPDDSPVQNPRRGEDSYTNNTNTEN